MKKIFKTLVLATALGTAGLVAMAQPMGGPEGHMGRMDPAKMQAMVAQRAEALKAQLKLTPEQEPAWQTFMAAMKPDARAMPQRPSREEMDKLTTPERIDKMRALRDQQHKDMQAAMDKRDEATKTFYATLNADQKKVFDAHHMRMGDHTRQGMRQANKNAKQPPKPAQ